MASDTIRPYIIESEDEAERYLFDLLEKPENQTCLDVEAHATIHCANAAIRHYFINRGMQLLKSLGVASAVETGALTREQSAFLKSLAQKAQLIAGSYDHRRLKRLIEMGYATSQTASLDSIIYTITDKGRAAVKASESSTGYGVAPGVAPIDAFPVATRARVSSR